MRHLRSSIFLTALFLVLTPTCLLAQDQKADAGYFKKQEDSLLVLVHKMFYGHLPGEHESSGFVFAKLLYKTLQHPNSFQYPFDSLSKKIHIMYPKDKRFRIFNWLVVPDPHMIRYYGIIQTKDTLYPLTNYSDRLIRSQRLLKTPLDTKHWFGAEYYKILTRRTNGQDYYFILGLNQDGTYSNKKIIDVLHFTDSSAIFGAPLFVYPTEDGHLQTQYRVVWQYKKGAAFQMNFDPNLKMITFDQLRSRISDPLRKNTYVPTGQVDGLNWQKGHWQFESNVIHPLKLKDGQAPINGVIQK